MPRPSENYQRWSAQATLGTGDTTKTVKASPGATNALVVTAYVYTSLTAAAQAVDLEDASGTVEVMKAPVSVAAAVQLGSRVQFEQGLKLTKNEALVLTPAAAGPGAHVWAEGYILPNQ